MRREEKRGDYGVDGLNPNFKVAAFEGFDGELHFRRIEEWKVCEGGNGSVLRLGDLNHGEREREP